MIGHNRGPALGRGWAEHCWRVARRELLPQVPLQIIRLRLKRAEELGLNYRIYAGIRAATGRDIVAFLFSSNALDVLPRRIVMPDVKAAKLNRLKDCGRFALVQPPMQAAAVLRANPALQRAAPAPRIDDGWSTIRERVRGVFRERGCPSDAVLVIGDTALEREWAEAGKCAGFLPSDRYFAAHRP
ncbi:MAG: hypothetical protein AAF982_02940 [Pseudomonadota bacterium]